MRIPRFYTPDSLEPGQAFTLSPELFRHAIQVLRLQPNDPMILFNGERGEYLCRLNTVSKREASLIIEAFHAVERESSQRLTLVQSIIKPDKMDFAIQKCTELGISVIQPVITQRSVVRLGQDKQDKKLAHWQAIAISACEQSGRTSIPDILPPLSLEHWLAQTPHINTARLFFMPGDYPRLNSLGLLPSDTQTIEVLIGPEGGFTEEEISHCLAQGLIGASLGPRVLRAETAAVTVTALLQHQHGDL